MKMLNNNIRRFIREEKVNKRNVTVFILLVVKFEFEFQQLWKWPEITPKWPLNDLLCPKYRI